MLVIAGFSYLTPSSEPIGTARFFAVLAVVAFTVEQMSYFSAAVPGCYNIANSLLRIQAFLCLPERTDSREFPDMGLIHQGMFDGLRNRNENEQQERYAVRMENVNVTDDLSGSVLRNLAVLIKRGEITMLIGSPGCGKTSVLNAILGEIRLRSGTVRLSSRLVAFAGQKPFLRKVTMRANIIGQREYNHELYQNVLYICDLEDLFESFPDRDRTVVGGNGVKLDDGQKQRIVSPTSVLSSYHYLVLTRLLALIVSRSRALF